MILRLNEQICLSQAGTYGNGGGGGGGITTVDGDTGTASGATINIITDVAANNSGSTIEFVGDNASTLTLNVSNTVLSNTFIGYNAGNTATTSNQSTGFGADALASITNGNYNNAFGNNALNALTTGANNCAMGTDALYQCNGSFNFGLGFETLFNLLTGDYNVAIGNNAGIQYTGSESGNIVLNSEGVIGDNNTLRIGSGTGNTNNQLASAYICGINGVNVGSTAKVVTMGTGGTADQLGTATITAGTGITVTPGANTITLATGSTVATSFPADSGTATPLAGVLDIFGDSHNITTTGSGHQVVVGLTGITQHSLQVGGASNALTQLGVATNGQLPIGSTGADPVLATITAGTGISVTNGAGSITIAASGITNITYTGVNHAASPYTVLTTDDYISADVTAGVISILLPNAPATGRVYYVKDKVGLAATSNITITTVGGAVNIDGATSFIMNTAYEAASLIFNGTSYEIF